MFFVPLNEFGIQFCPYASLGANTIGCVKRSCLLLLRLQGCWGSFLKLTYMLINKDVNWAIKKVGKGLGLYPPFQI